MGEHVVTMSNEQMRALTEKLDQFGETLSADERQVVGALLSGAMGAAAASEPDVAGFGLMPDVGFQLIVPNPRSFGLLGDSLRLGGARQLGLHGSKTASQ